MLHFISDVAEHFIYSQYQFLNIGDFYPINLVLNKAPDKKSYCVISGDRGGQRIGPPRPIHRKGKELSRECRINNFQFGVNNLAGKLHWAAGFVGCSRGKAKFSSKST